MISFGKNNIKLDKSIKNLSSHKFFFYNRHRNHCKLNIHREEWRYLKNFNIFYFIDTFHGKNLKNTIVPIDPEYVVDFRPRFLGNEWNSCRSTSQSKQNSRDRTYPPPPSPPRRTASLGIPWRLQLIGIVVAIAGHRWSSRLLQSCLAG